MWDHEEKFQILRSLASMRTALSHIAKQSDYIAECLGIIIDNQNLDAEEEEDDDE